MDEVETLRQFSRERRKRKLQDAAQRRETFEKALPNLVQGLLSVDPEIEQIILFGSLTHPQDPNVGDIDLALRSPNFLKAAGWLLRQDLPIDIVDIEDVHGHIRERILTEGRVLYGHC